MINSTFNILKPAPKFIFTIIILYFCVVNKIYALETASKTWGDLNISGQLFNVPNLEYLFDDQPRYDNSQNQFQRNFAKAGIGYEYTPNLTLWLGYQYNTKNEVSGSPPENRIWEMVNWNIITQQNFTLTSQSRLEQRFLNGQTDSSERFRQKLIIKFPDKILGEYTPVFSDEVFINITRPSWVTTRVLGQNHAFIGVDIPTSKKTYLEIGYLNQYFFQETSANQMNNVLYIGFYINT